MEPPKLIVAILGRPLALCCCPTHKSPEILFKRTGEPQESNGGDDTHMPEIAPALSGCG